MSQTPTQPRDDLWVWIDLEMTGLDPTVDTIIEIATVVTDGELEVIAEGPEIAIHQPLERLEAMDDWNREQHTRSGLWQRVLESRIDLPTAEAMTLEFLRRHVKPGTSPLCGNTVCQDRRFIAPYMPQLDAFLHYRLLDVSTIKILARRWAPSIAAGMQKQSAHTALADIRESIEELRYYRRFMGALSGLPG
ncbi:MAG: oligoribonuclease [Lysobacteraceae bacterium]|nr:MAG: oligoribonuclease [Xanthomonadaceae bacterium]